MEGGGICGSTFQPELDHIDGFQPGKPITARDLRVCCRPHNGIHADQVYGRDYMRSFRKRPHPHGEPRGTPAAAGS
jgi:hypothetical protein